MTLGEMIFVTIVLGAIALLVVYAVLRSHWKKITIVEYQLGLKYVKGKFVGILQPGEHSIHRSTTNVQIVDVRPRFVTINGQEVLSSDGITLKVSLAAQFEMVDPVKAVNGVQNCVEALYLIIQMALRTIISTGTIDELLEKRDEFGPKLMEATASKMEEIGIKLLLVDVKDIMLPGEVKKLFNQIVKARKEGMASLERARGETAALRNLANAAQMMEDHPSLLQLRALQQIGESTGNTLVIGLPQGTVPLPAKGKKPVEPSVDENA
jgi:regulator of protease activity HflC (stomatin/prohibitin superfamily)